MVGPRPQTSATVALKDFSKAELQGATKGFEEARLDVERCRSVVVPHGGPAVEQIIDVKTYPCALEPARRAGASELISEVREQFEIHAAIIGEPQVSRRVVRRGG